MRRGPVGHFQFEPASLLVLAADTSIETRPPQSI
jgi:hypothetical protein